MKVFIAGHNGMVGSSFKRILEEDGGYEVLVKNKSELNLLDQSSVYNFLKKEKPEFVYMAAAKVGGIYSNDTYRADFIFENLQIQNNVIFGSHLADIDNLFFLGSSCVYPKLCPQPIKEDYLLTSELEKTNEPYAVAKIAGLKLCENLNKQYGRKYSCLMPTNLYGIGDNYHLSNSHVLPALIAKSIAAQRDNSSLKIWGTGKPLREFLYVDDLSYAAHHLLKQGLTYDLINIGSGDEISINDLGYLILELIDYRDGIIEFDQTKPDGTPRKLLDISKIKGTGWQTKYSLSEGIKISIQDYKKNFSNQSLRSK